MMKVNISPQYSIQTVTHVFYPPPIVSTYQLMEKNIRSSSIFVLKQNFNEFPSYQQIALQSKQFNNSFQSNQGKDLVNESMKMKKDFTRQNYFIKRLEKISLQLELLDKKLDQITTVEKYPGETIRKITNIRHNQNQITHVKNNGDNSSTSIFSEKKQSQTTPSKKKSINRQRKYECSQFQSELSTDKLNAAQIMKGKQYGDHMYFGDLNARGEREGYGYEYDKFGRLIYNGYWVNDKYHKRGKIYFYDQIMNEINDESFNNQHNVQNNIISYTGEFTDGEIQGLGQMQFSQISRKERFVFYGRFERGKFHGRGSVLCYTDTLDSDCSKGFEGEWANGIIYNRKEISHIRSKSDNKFNH